MIWDTFMIGGNPNGPELDMLELRLTELEDVPGLIHVAVEADVDHQGKPKPYWVTEHLERFAPWKERLRVVRATDLPTVADYPDPWAREHAQREHARYGMQDVQADDLVMHGDLDEIPNPFIVRQMPLWGPAARDAQHVFRMIWCSFAVDWVCPQTWNGTVVSNARRVESFGAMRDRRNYVTPIKHPGGFHLGWLGGNEAAWLKLRSFCHPEIEARIADGLTADNFLLEGWHVDGQKMVPVDVDDSWPRYIRERRCPESWFRPRQGPQFHEAWFSDESCKVLAELAGSTNGLCGRVVEIGSWEGKSTIALAGAVQPQLVHAVDTWSGSAGEVSEILAGERDVFATFTANTAGLNVKPFRMDWRAYVKEHNSPIRFAFIDALHTYEEVRDQIAAIRPLMVPGGVLCGDDQHHPPIRQAVSEAFPDAHVAASLWFVKLP